MILVTDAPCHGRKYHQNVNDYYLDEPIEDALDMIIENNMNLLILKINNRTDTMIRYFEDYFIKKNSAENILVLSLEDTEGSDLSEKFSNII
jgi:myosin protein heavy chain